MSRRRTEQQAPKNAAAAAVYVAPDSLRPWQKNPRKNTEAVEAVAASIRRFGFGAPILARRKTRVIIAGHTRWEAAKNIGLEEVPVRFLDLSEADAELLALADNKTAEIATWDDAALGRVLADLRAQGADVLASGFGGDEIDALIAAVNAQALAEVEEDPVPERPQDPTSREGEIYELGPHRLLCGDSTRIEDVERLLAGEKADMLFTDPPYGVSYQSNMRTASPQFAVIANDDLRPDDLREFLASALSTASAVLRPGAAVYVCHSDQRLGLRPAFESAFERAGFHLGACIVWVKPAATMGWQDYRNQYEPILYGWRVGADRNHVEDRTQTTVWEIGRDADYVHPTQKPVELPERAVKNSTRAGDLVLDLFGGSGSTMIAAARAGRRAVLVEKDRGYCDVIRTRWANFVAKASP